MAEAPTPANDEFISLLTTYQAQLRGVVMAGLGNYANCQDVLQRTNLAIWKKSAEFDSERSFLAWAVGIARYEVLAFIRDRQRERLVFTPDVADLLLTETRDQLDAIPARQLALRQCVSELPEASRDVLRLKYVRAQSIQQVSDATGRSLDGVKSLLLRVRKLLAECIERRLAAQS